MMRFLGVLGWIVVALASIGCSPAFAQGTCANIFEFGVVPTPGQWQQCLATKENYLGYTPLNPGNIVASTPITVIAAGGILTFGLGYNSSLAVDGSGNLGIDLAHSNVFTAAQTMPSLTANGIVSLTPGAYTAAVSGMLVGTCSYANFAYNPAMVQMCADYADSTSAAGALAVVLAEATNSGTRGVIGIVGGMTVNNAAGMGWGANFVCRVGVGGGTCWGAEIDVTALSGVTGSKVVGLGVMAVGTIPSGNTIVGLGFGAENTAGQMSVGIQFGTNFGGLQPLATTGTMIQTVGSATVANFVDISSYTVSGCVLKLTFGCVAEGAAGLTVASGATALPSPQSGAIFQGGSAATVVARAELDSIAAAAHFSGVRADGIGGSPSALVTNDEIASFNAYGYDGATYSGPHGGFRCYAEDVWSSVLHGTYCDAFVTAGTVSAAATEAMRFENDGGVTVPSAVTGGSKGAGAINISGNYYIAGAVAATTVNGQSCGLSGACTITAAATSMAVGTTSVLSGTGGDLLYNNGGTLGNETLASLLASPPAIGATTPAAGTFTTATAAAAVVANAAGDGTASFQGNGGTRYWITAQSAGDGNLFCFGGLGASAPGCGGGTLAVNSSGYLRFISGLSSSTPNAAIFGANPMIGDGSIWARGLVELGANLTLATNIGNNSYNEFETVILATMAATNLSYGSFKGPLYLGARCSDPSNLSMGIFHSCNGLTIYSSISTGNTTGYAEGIVVVTGNVGQSDQLGAGSLIGVESDIAPNSNDVTTGCTPGVLALCHLNYFAGTFGQIAGDWVFFSQQGYISGVPTGVGVPAWVNGVFVGGVSTAATCAASYSALAYCGNAITIPNNTSISAVNGSNTAPVKIVSVDVSNNIQLGAAPVYVNDGLVMAAGAITASGQNVLLNSPTGYQVFAGTNGIYGVSLSNLGVSLLGSTSGTAAISCAAVCGANTAQFSAAGLTLNAAIAVGASPPTAGTALNASGTGYWTGLPTANPGGTVSNVCWGAAAGGLFTDTAAGCGAGLPKAGGSLTGTITFVDGSTWSSTGPSIVSMTSIGTANAPDSWLTIYANTDGATVAPPTGTNLHIVGLDATATAVTMDAFGQANQFIGRTAEGTLTSMTATESGRIMLTQIGQGWDGSAYATGAAIRINAQANWTTAPIHTTDITFLTTTGAGSLTQAVEIYGSGGLGVGSVPSDPGAGGVYVGGQIKAPSITQTSAAVTGTVCWTTGTGAFTIDTTLACLSSLEELKVKQGSIAGAMDIVRRLDPFWYRWQYDTAQSAGDPYIQAGFGAHQVESVDKRLVAYGADGELRGVRYLQMTAVLAAAWQEQDAQVSELSVRLDAVDAANDNRDRRIVALEAENEALRAANDNVNKCLASTLCRLTGSR